jgi:hypothetical protein
MATVDLTRDALVVHVHGVDQVFALKSQLTIPLAHVRGAAVDPAAAAAWPGLRLLGGRLPGVFAVGTFHRDGERVFWDVHDPARAVVVELADERYARLVVGVADPAATAAAINRAVGNAAAGGGAGFAARTGAPR